MGIVEQEVEAFEQLPGCTIRMLKQSENLLRRWLGRAATQLLSDWKVVEVCNLKLRRVRHLAEDQHVSYLAQNISLWPHKPTMPRREASPFSGVYLEVERSQQFMKLRLCSLKTA